LAAIKCQEMYPTQIGKSKFVDYLKSKQSTGVTWTAIDNGIFFDLQVSNHRVLASLLLRCSPRCTISALAVGFFGTDMANHKPTIWDSGDVKFSTTTRATIGKAVAAVLAQPEKTANQFLFISSFEITQNERVASLEKATGVGNGISSTSPGTSRSSRVERCWRKAN